MTRTATARKESGEPRPIMRPGELWRLKDALRALGVNARTLARWKAAGLKTLQPGTSRKYVTSDEIIRIMHEDIPATYEPEFKQRGTAK